MYNSDKLYIAKFSHPYDEDPLFEGDYFQDIEVDGEFDQFLDMTDLDEADDLLH